MSTIKINIEGCNGISNYNGKPTYQFTDKEAADQFSEDLKGYWEQGVGQVYGPFTLMISKKQVWEVTVPDHLV